MTSTVRPAAGFERLSTGDEVEVVCESVAIGAPGIATIEIDRPSDPASLLQGWCNAADLAVPIPYWAEIWPAAKALARRVAHGAPLAGLTVLDLGCGLGLSGIAAGLRGGRVKFVDNHPDALRFAARNAAGARVSAVEFQMADWREPAWASPVDLVLGADVIYERSEHEAMQAVLERLLAGGGSALLGDPCRDIGDQFLELWRSAHSAATVRVEPMPGEDVASAIHELRL